MDIIRKFILFTGVGAIGTGTHYLILVILVQALSINPVLASSAGALSGALVNYLLNYRYTFHSRKRHREAMTKFFTVAAVGFVLNGLLMTLGDQVLHLHYLLSQIIATVVVLMWNFAGNHFWTFNGEKDETR